MSGIGVPGIPARNAGKDADSTRLDERKIEEEVHRHEAQEEAAVAEPKRVAEPQPIAER